MNFLKLAVFTVLLTFTPAVFAEDAYLCIPIRSLSFVGQGLPAPSGSAPIRWQTWAAERPYVALDGDGEAYVQNRGNTPWNGNDSLAQERIAIRAPKGKEITGRLFVSNPTTNGMVALKFKVNADSAPADGRGEFLKVKEEHYRTLLDRNIPGGAWFRHQEAESAKALGHTEPTRPAMAARFNRPTRLDPEGSYELFSGGRAISENLQLDRLLRESKPGPNTVDIGKITGITVQEMDWKPLIKGVKPEIDPLASYIPADQHAIFFASFAAMTELIDEADADGTPVLQMFEPRSEDAGSRFRYQKQLCLELNEVSRLLGPQVIAGTAFTGSDPYLRTGSDVAILFQSKSPALLRTFIAARQTGMKQSNATVKAVSGEVQGVAYSGVVSPDRSISSYVAALDDIVFVSNSLYQLGCLVDAAKGKKPAIASQDEYIFFRNRYRRSEKGESAFVILTDATIRRWCGPRWRIGNARRTRVAAALAELQAARLDEIVKGTAKPGRIQTDLCEDGEIQLTTHGIVSSTYGSLDFLTPIGELPLDKVTSAEADAYKTWRDGYQQNWRQSFDPIAVRVSSNARQLSAEVTVMPLIAGTDYRDVMEITRNARVTAGSGDSHPEALVHLAMAINPQSRLLKQSEGMFGSMNSPLNANPLGWLGQSIAIYADQDPFWAGLKGDQSKEYLEKNFPQLPVALQCEVKNPLGVAAFLTALRGYAEQTAPRMTVWQNLEYKGLPYVKVGASTASDQRTLQQRAFDRMAVYYAVTPKSLLVTLSEPLLKRALDRQSAGQAAKADPGKPWLGENLCLQLNHQFLDVFQSFSREHYQTAQQMLCWNNLPILNEWKRLYPSQDPVKLHEELWQTKLLCPGGGAYVWNAEWQTMESTVYGHPGAPKNGPAQIARLANIQALNLGLTFENQGLSAKAVIDRQSTPPQLARKGK